MELENLNSEANVLRCSAEKLFQASNSTLTFIGEADCNTTNNIQVISTSLENFESEIEKYEKMANESTTMLIQNGHEIQKFAHDRKLDALISAKNYENGIYKNYQTKIQVRI